MARPHAELHTATTLRRALTLLENLSPRLAIVDLSMPDGDGIDFFRHAREQHPHKRGILLSGSMTDVDVQRALSAQCAAIVDKADPPDELRAAVVGIEEGGNYWAPSVADIVASLAGKALFSPRMIEVLDRLQAGLSNKQIAADLGISEPTVTFHINQLKARLGARTNRQVVSQAQKLGVTVAS